MHEPSIADSNKKLETYKIVVVHDCPSTLLIAAAILSISDVNQNTFTALDSAVVPPKVYENCIIVAVTLANNAATVDTLSKSDRECF